jgi:DNA mismatch endonuclease (patch repair protein)
VAFTRARVAVFLDGCFWHGCPIHGNTPKANAHYWRPKLEHNRTRDRQVTAALEADSWTVLRIWEHVPVAEAVERVVAAVEASAV